jgi:hypothetical protein
MRWWVPNTNAELWSDPPWDEYVAIYGDSPRGQGISHIVISRRGRIVHDPHPDRTGILTTNGAWWLVPTDSAPGAPAEAGTP